MTETCRKVNPTEILLVMKRGDLSKHPEKKKAHRYTFTDSEWAPTTRGKKEDFTVIEQYLMWKCEICGRTVLQTTVFKSPDKTSGTLIEIEDEATE